VRAQALVALTLTLSRRERVPNQILFRLFSRPFTAVNIALLAARDR
jgi:hypothetical protein